MGNQCDPRPVRFPPKIDFLIREFAKKKGITLNQAIVHLVAKGHSAYKAEEEFHVSEYIENFFEKE